MSDRREPSESRKSRAASASKGAAKESKRSRHSRTSADSDVAASAETVVATSTPRVTSTHGPRSVPQRPRSRGRGEREPEVKKVRPVLKLLNGLLTFLVVVLVGAGGSIYYLLAAVDAEGPLAEAKLFVVPRNDGTQQIAERLEKEGLVTDRRMFLAGLYTLRAASIMPGGHTLNLKAGEYEIKPGASIRSIVETMAEGRSVLMKVTIPEGLTTHQIVERLKNDVSLTGDIREVPPEGSLLPETYSLPRGSTRQSLIDMMQAAQRKLLDQLWNERQEGLPYKTPAEALVLASIVEKETGRNDERERVASVFVNRLRKGMKLQSDPTILYGLALGKVQWGKPIFASEINSRTAHNTYVIPGLPPTPICNPGRAAIEAVLKPASGNDLFFVADGRGGHVFAETNKQHEANVAKWRQVERDRASAAQGAQSAPAQAPAPVTTTINSGTTSRGGSSLAPAAPQKAPAPAAKSN